MIYMNMINMIKIIKGTLLCSKFLCVNQTQDFLFHIFFLNQIIFN